MVIETFLEQVNSTSQIEWFGTITGILGVWLCTKENNAAWPCFILCYIAYAALSYQFELFITMGMNITFSIISIYGWIKWTRSGPEISSQNQVKRTQINERILLFVVCITTSIVFLLILPAGTLSRFEAIASSTALIAQWMLSRKQVESWILWILSDLIFIYIWGKQGAILTAGLFTIFTLLAFKGWRDWAKQLPKQNDI